MSSIIAVDFSILSSAAAKFSDGKVELYSFPAMESKYYNDWYTDKKLKKFEIHKNIEDVVKVAPYLKEAKKSDNYQEAEIVKLINARNLAHTMLSVLMPKSDDILVLEGFSYMSKGLSFVDLIEYNSIFRYVFTRLIKEDNMIVIPPTDNKKDFSGKGNADKLVMYDAFMKMDYKYQFKDMLVNSNGIYINREKREVAKPIDDIIDAISLLQTFIKKYE